MWKTKIGSVGDLWWEQNFDFVACVSWVVRGVGVEMGRFCGWIESVDVIRGRTLREPQKRVTELKKVKISDELRAPFREIRLFIDVLWFLGLPFLHTISKNIGARTSAIIPNRESDSLKKALLSVINM